MYILLLASVQKKILANLEVEPNFQCEAGLDKGVAVLVGFSCRLPYNVSTRGYGSTHQFRTHCHLIRLEESLLSGVVTCAKCQQWKYADGCWHTFALHSGTKATRCELALFGERKTLVQFLMQSFEAGVKSQGSSFLGLKTWMSAAR